MQSIRQISRFNKRASEAPKKNHRAASDETLEGAEKDAYQGESGHPSHLSVAFDEGDPDNPQNWPTSKKWRIMSIVGCTGFVVGWASSIDSTAAPQIAEVFHVSKLVESLATGLFLIGFAAGSLVAGPFSETVGRNPVYIGSLVLFMIFTMASGLAPNIAAQLVFRFIAGVFACTPLTTFGGSMSDMFNTLQRTYVFPVCACLSFLGPFLAPMVGSFIGQYGDWRWCEWSTLILGGVITSLIALFVPETYAPIILSWKAKALRNATGQDYRADIELRQQSLTQMLLQNSYRPFQMFCTEIMVTLFTLYLTVVYIVLFGFLVGYEYIFGDTYKLSQGETGLCFIGMNVGFLVALAIVPGIYWHYSRKHHHHRRRNEDVPPEHRLWYCMLGAPWLPISIVWMGWTAYPSVSIWCPLVGSVMFGFATQGIFISTYGYLIDAYEQYAASALVSATFLRYLAAGVMQVVSIPMYENLGVHWAMTLLGCLSVLMTPVPFVFYFYGAKIRERSKTREDEQ